MADRDSAQATGRSGEFDVVGHSPPRIEGFDKVTGRAEFTDDIDLHGMVYAKVFCSPVAHEYVLICW